MADNSSMSLFEDKKTVALIAGVIAIALLSLLLLWWVFKPSYELLMASPGEADMAKAVHELDSQNIEYQIAENGESILVKKADSAKARKALSELGLPYEATVGLELFANSDFGVTEFAQKVNYKRALEGELTRTISSLSEVRYARVHLVLPEKKLFDKQSNEATAAITLFLRDGVFLDAEQIKGIQSLVSHSVPKVKQENVTVLDQGGMVLSRSGQVSGGVATSGLDNLKEKRSHEHYIRSKVERLLNTGYANTPFTVEVDVKLTTVSSKVVEKTLLPVSNGKGALMSSRFTTNTSDAESGDSQAKTNEEQYQYGSRVEERFNSAGVEKKVTIAVLIGQYITEDAAKQLSKLIYASAGLNEERGDYVAVVGQDSQPQFSEPAEQNSLVASAVKNQPQSTALNGYEFLKEDKVIIALLISSLVLMVAFLITLIVLVKARSVIRASKLTDQQKAALVEQLNAYAENRHE